MHSSVRASHTILTSDSVSPFVSSSRSSCIRSNILPTNSRGLIGADAFAALVLEVGR